MPVADFNPAVFEYDIELPVGTTEVPLVEGIPADPNATVVVVPAWDLPGTSVVDIFSEDLLHRMTYQIHFTVAVGVDEPGAKSDIRVYPNPANNRVYFQGCNKADIRIFSITGLQVTSVNGFTGNFMDVSSLANGIYTLQIVTEDHSTVTKKITILR
jgi:hypothetical protein